MDTFEGRSLRISIKFWSEYAYIKRLESLETLWVTLLQNCSSIEKFWRHNWYNLMISSEKKFWVDNDTSEILKSSNIGSSRFEVLKLKSGRLEIQSLPNCFVRCLMYLETHWITLLQIWNLKFFWHASPKFMLVRRGFEQNVWNLLLNCMHCKCMGATHNAQHVLQYILQYVLQHIFLKYTVQFYI